MTASWGPGEWFAVVWVVGWLIATGFIARWCDAPRREFRRIEAKQNYVDLLPRIAAQEHDLGMHTPPDPGCRQCALAEAHSRGGFLSADWQPLPVETDWQRR